MQQKENRRAVSSAARRKEKHHLATVFENNKESQICGFCCRSITIFSHFKKIRAVLTFVATIMTSGRVKFVPAV